MDYKLHLPEYLAKCINKNRPELHCNGQCVLMKKLRVQEKEETKKNMVVFEGNAFYLHEELTLLTKSTSNIDLGKVYFSPYILHYKYQFNHTVFRPPLYFS